MPEAPTPQPIWENAPVMNAAQLGGIETSVLDNGPGRNLRIAWVNTGGGLRYKVVIDRGLDIADAEFMGQSLTWHSSTGITAPAAACDTGFEWLRGFYGGLLVSCGPLNVGNPFTEDGRSYGLHGTHSNTPAQVESIANPDLAKKSYEMSITGIVRTARVFGPYLELRRTISSQLGEPVIRIRDAFRNLGNKPAPLAWLLHINVGYPLLEPRNSYFCFRGETAPLAGSEAWYESAANYRQAPPPMELHRGAGEFCAYIHAEPNRDGTVTCGVVNIARKLALKLCYRHEDFPRLVNWQHWGPGGSYAAALEPTNAGVEGRPIDAQRGWLNYLEPGEERTFSCELAATGRQQDIEELLELNRTSRGAVPATALAQIYSENFA
ncbi:MAG: DUF4432 family protein [Pirellulales bacterium]|nr:DUF4432 family protein [Pirellulales bacterium]